MTEVRELTETFLTEWRVFDGLYGRSYPEQMQWARTALPPDSVDHYMHSWALGRDCTERYLRWMAAHLRRVAGEDAASWLERCAHPHERAESRSAGGAWAFLN